MTNMCMAVLSVSVKREVELTALAEPPVIKDLKIDKSTRRLDEPADFFRDGKDGVGAVAHHAGTHERR